MPICNKADVNTPTVPSVTEVGHSVAECLPDVCQVCFQFIIPYNNIAHLMVFIT